MPQILVLAAIGGGAYLGARWLKRKFTNMQRDFANSVPKTRPPSEPQKASHDEAQTMEYDPKTGVYRIKGD